MLGNNITLTNRSKVVANGSDTAAAGNIQIQAVDTFLFNNGAQLSTQVTETGGSGNIQILGNVVDITAGASIQNSTSGKVDAAGYPAHRLTHSPSVMLGVMFVA